jgi:hypothetical protein
MIHYLRSNSEHLNHKANGAEAAVCRKFNKKGRLIYSKLGYTFKNTYVLYNLANLNGLDVHVLQTQNHCCVKLINGFKKIGCILSELHVKLGLYCTDSK